MTEATADVEAVVRGIKPNEADFLRRVIENRELAIADRVEDRARQRLRRLGLVKVANAPRRWVALPLGYSVHRLLSETPNEPR